ncbi:MAG: ATP-dependent Clp protease adapter ClpS [Deltaproteobacteria bacterium]|nr:ATP-dependent Clp protease adapter ClpS [Deltaproteobacteria bacterium]MBW2662174.1 ATP-dependent Clp protease adapter ClpS [Deltaproteobacteria bacterium]
MGKCSSETDDSVFSETLDEIKEPSMYRVLIHNDDYTSMEFVVEILVSVFNKSLEEAIRIMLKVHREGIGFCGVYIYDVAETKVRTVETRARGNGFPLKCSMERDL